MPKSSFQSDLTYLIARAHRRLHAKLEQLLQQDDLTVEQWRVLEVLNARDGCSMGELAELVLMNHPALTKLADRMVGNGLIHRVVDAADQRRVLVHNTERGHAVFQRLSRRVNDHHRDIERALDGGDANSLRTILRALERNAVTETVDR